MPNAEQTVKYRGFIIRAWETGRRSATEGQYVVTNPNAIAPEVAVILGAVKVAENPELETFRATIQAAKTAIDRLLLARQSGDTSTTG